MNNKERLEKIINRVTEDVDFDDAEWLIEQAKKVEEYKDALENLEGELSRGYPY